MLTFGIVTSFQYLEPIGSSAPKFPSSRVTSGFVELSHKPISLSCPAQGFPVPSIRYVILRNLVISEPIGSSLPKFLSKSIDVLVIKSSEMINLVCPAQGYPLPSFR